MPGYVVTLKGDTIKGWIKAESKFNNARSVAFRNANSPDAQPEVFTPINLLAYGDTANHYRPFEILLENKEKKSVFLKIIIDGQLSLYKLDYKFSDSPTAMEYTAYDEEFFYLKLKDKPMLEIRRVGMLQQSFNYMPGCEAVASKINNMGYQYSEKSLAQMAIDYNRCFAPVPYKDYRQVGVQPKIKFGFTLALALTSIQRDPYAGRFPATMAVWPGFFADVKWSKHIHTRTILSYVTKHSTESTKWTVEPYYANAGQQFTLKNRVRMNLLTWSQLTTYNFRIGNLEPYISAGIGLGIRVADRISREQRDYTYVAGQPKATATVTETTPIPGTKKLVQSEFTASLGAGIFCNTKVPLVLDIRYEVGRPQTRSYVQNLHNNSLIFGVGILF